jgi:phage-related protein
MSNVIANISVAASLEKARLSTSEQWLPLVVITWPDSSILRLVRNTDDITFDCGDGAGPQVYTAFSWEFDSINEKSDGSIPTWAVRCSNVNRAVEALLEEYGGGVGGSIAVYVVNTKRLKREPELELYFGIAESSSNAQWVSFTLGAPSQFRILYTRYTYSPDKCIWPYKSSYCGYAGALPSCSLRLGGSNGCRAHNNVPSYGAFPGVDSNGVSAVTVK